MQADVVNEKATGINGNNQKSSSAADLATKGLHLNLSSVQSKSLLPVCHSQFRRGGRKGNLIQGLFPYRQRMPS